MTIDGNGVAIRNQPLVLGSPSQSDVEERFMICSNFNKCTQDEAKYQTDADKRRQERVLKKITTGRRHGHSSKYRFQVPLLGQKE